MLLKRIKTEKEFEKICKQDIFEYGYKLDGDPFLYPLDTKWRNLMGKEVKAIPEGTYENGCKRQIYWLPEQNAYAAYWFFSESKGLEIE